MIATLLFPSYLRFVELNPISTFFTSSSFSCFYVACLQVSSLCLNYCDVSKDFTGNLVIYIC